MKEKIRKICSKSAMNILSLLFIGMAFVFITRMIGDQWAFVKEGPETINWKMLFAGVFFFEIYWIYQVLHWKRIMNVMGSNLSFLQALLFFFSNNLLAYIPGKIANVAGMAVIAQKSNVSRMHTVTTVVLFQIYSLVSGTALIALLRLLFDQNIERLIPEKWIPVLCLMALGGLVIMAPKLMNRIIAMIKKLTGREIREVNLTFKYHLTHLIIYFFSWMIMGVAMWFILASFSEKTLFDIPLISVTIVIVASYLMGLLAFFVPAGLGVAEVGIVYGFMKLCEPAQAVWGAASFRLVALTTTLFSFLITFYVSKYFAKTR